MCQLIKKGQNMKTQTIGKNNTINFQKARTGKTQEQLMASIFNYSPTARIIKQTLVENRLNPPTTIGQRIKSFLNIK